MAEWLAEERLLLIQGWARDGLSYEQIAKNCGVTKQCLFNWREKSPEIAEALRKGREVVDRELENALIKRALGFTLTKTRIIEDDKGKKRIETIVEEVAPDTAAIIFALKNRKPDTWRDKRETNITADVEDLSPLVELLK